MTRSKMAKTKNPPVPILALFFNLDLLSIGPDKDWFVLL
jgi:hypothetical protein